MANRFEVPESMIRVFTDGERIVLPDGVVCIVKVLGRVVLFNPIDESLDNFRLSSDGTIIRHVEREIGPRNIGHEEETGWKLEDMSR